MSGAASTGSPPTTATAKSASPQLSRPSSSASACSRHTAGPSDASGPMTLYHNPFSRGGGFRNTATSPSPPLRISTRRLQVFSYVLAELSSAATLLPDYTRAILNLSRKLIGAWQAITAAAIARTRYEHALIWAAYRHRQQQQQLQYYSSFAVRHATTRVGRRGGAKRHSTSPSLSVESTTTDTENTNVDADTTTHAVTPSAAASLFSAATSAASSSHKRRRLAGREDSSSNSGHSNNTVSVLRHPRSSSALKLRSARFDAGAEQKDGLRVPLPLRVASSPAARSQKQGRATKGVTHGQRGVTGPPLSLPPSGVAERRARKLACRHREQLFLNTLQQLWIDAQEKEDKAGQHVEHLRGVIVNAIFQQYLGVTVEQSYYDLVLYRWLTPVLVSVRDGSDSCGSGSRAVGSRQAREGDNEGAEAEAKGPHHRDSSRHGRPPPLASHVRELEHGGGGAVRRARRRQAAAQVAKDLQLLRQMLMRAQIAAGPSTAAAAAAAATTEASSAAQKKRRRSGMQRSKVDRDTTQPSLSVNTSDPLATALPSALSHDCSTSSSSSSSWSSAAWKKRQRSPSTFTAAPPQTRPTTEKAEGSAAQRAASVTNSPASLVGEKLNDDDHTTSPPPPSHFADVHQSKSNGTDQEESIAPTFQAAVSDDDGFAGTSGGAPSTTIITTITTAAAVDEDANSLYATLHDGAHSPPERCSPVLPEGSVAVPLPLQLFIQACTSFDPTHCAFSLMSRCVLLAQHVRSEDEEQAEPVNSAASTPSKPVLFDGQRSHKGSPAAAGGWNSPTASEDTEAEAARDTGQEEEYAGLFYVLIARRAVGACGHRALCFGNHKFIFVGCRDTEALIREVMFNEEDDEEEEGTAAEGKPEEMAGHQNRDADFATGLMRDNAEPAMATHVNDAAWVPRRWKLSNSLNDGDKHRAQTGTLGVAQGDAERGEVGRPAVQDTTVLSTGSLHTPTCTDSREATAKTRTSKVNNASDEKREKLGVSSPLLPPSPAPHSHVGITALTEQDARRLQRNANMDVSALCSLVREDGFAPTVATTTNSGAMEEGTANRDNHHATCDVETAAVPFSTSFVTSAVHTAASAQLHVAPMLRPPLSRAASTNSTVSSNASSSAAAATARRWGRHMRQAASAGSRAKPPPFVSNDAMDFQVNTGFAETAMMPSLPAPPARTLRSHAVQDAVGSSPCGVLHGQDAVWEGHPQRRGSITTIFTDMETPPPQLPPPHVSPASISSMEHFFGADGGSGGDRSLNVSVQSPLHLTPLAFHTRLHPSSSSDRARVPPPLELTPQGQQQQHRLETSHASAADERSMVGEELMAVPTHKPPDAVTAMPTSTTTLFPTRGRSSSGSPSMTDTNEHHSYTVTEEDSEDDAREEVDTAAAAAAQRSAMREGDMDDTQPLYVVMHSALCSCIRSGGGDRDRSSSSCISRDNNNHATTSASNTVGEGYPPSAMPSAKPRESAFPFSLRAAEAFGGLSWAELDPEHETAALYDNFPMSYFEQQVLLPPGSGQERRSNSNVDPTHEATSDLRLASALSAIQSSSAQAAAASHLLIVADTTHTAATGTRGMQLPAAKEKIKEEAATEVVENVDGDALPHRGEHSGSLPIPGSSRGGLQEDLQQRNGDRKATAVGGFHEDCGPSPMYQAPSSPSPPSLSVEPTEGDMAFAAELYSRLAFWSLRGQDRSAYVDPSWLRGGDPDTESKRKRRGTAAAAAAAARDGKDENEDAQPPAVVKHPPKDRAAAATASRTEEGGGGVAFSHQRRNSRSRSRSRTSTATTADNGEYDHAGSGESTTAAAAAGVVRLPLMLLDYAAGTIELADEALLAEQARKKKAEKAAKMRTRHRGRQRGLHERRQRTGNEEGDEVGEETNRDSAGSAALHEDDEAADSDSNSEEEEEEEEEGSFPYFTPPLTVNARGKKLLFEALHAATEVVVCAVRESRAHAGYHDVLHQRCPPPSASSPTTHPSCTTPATSAPTPNRSGGSIDFGCASPIAEMGALTAVNSWAVTAVAAAAQGFTFPVSTGTLSHDERCPFTFDQHQHLGTYGTVQWSQGIAAVAEDHEGGEGGGTGAVVDVSDSSLSLLPAPAPSSHVWRWPALPSNDEKQWRCELLKSEFRLARSRRLDALLVDRVHGRLIAAITLEPRTWTQVREARLSPAAFASRANSRGEHDIGNGGASDAGRAEAAAAATANTPGFGGHDDQRNVDASADDSPLRAHLPTSTQEVVQRTVYVVTSFTHYVAPLWRHLREEKAVLVDMDRTLVDNIITVRTVAERQRHLLHLNRAVSAAEGKAGARNPCILWHAPPQCRPSSARFAAPPFRLGRNDALPMSYEEVLWGEGPAATAAAAADGGLNVHAASTTTTTTSTKKGRTSEKAGSACVRCSSRPAPSTTMPLSSTQQDARRRQDASFKAEGEAENRGGEGLLHAFLYRTTAQREALGTLHYEECGAVIYAAAAASAAALFSSNPNKGKERHGAGDVPADACDRRSGGGALPATPLQHSVSLDRTGVYSDLVYVRPGVRQFLFRTAVQWNIPVVLVTKSTRSRTEAILNTVLDPHRFLFPDPKLCIVTADELLGALTSLAADEHLHTAAVQKQRNQEGRGEDEEAVEEKQRRQSSSMHGEQLPAGPTAYAPNTTAERIARCHKSTLRVLQSVLDAAALKSAQRAWRAPPWCDLPARLPKPRSVAVLDDAPQVWEECDWPCTVNVTPYTLARVDPRSYFAPHGFMSALVLSCLYGSRCLVCSAGELHVGAGRVSYEQGSRRGSPLRYGESGGRSPLSDATRVGPERWPHCICVCPPDHQDEITRAEEAAQGDFFTSYADDAAASVRAMLTDLVWRAAGPAAGGVKGVALLRRLRPLLLPAVSADASTVEEGPSPRSAKYAAATARRYGNVVNTDDESGKARSASCEEMGDPGGRSAQCRPCASGFHGHTSSIIEDVQPLPQPNATETSPASSASASVGDSAGRPGETSAPQKAANGMTHLSSSRTTAPMTRAPPCPAPTETITPNPVDLRGDNNNWESLRVDERDELHSLPSSLTMDAEADLPATSTSSSSSSSSLPTPASLSAGLAQDLRDSPFSLPNGAGVGASMPATPTSFCALPDPWPHTVPPADMSASAITHGVADGAVNSSVEDVLGSAVATTNDCINNNSVHSSDAGRAARQTGNPHEMDYEDVEPVVLTQTRNGEADVEDVTADAQYAPATATRSSVWRSNSSSSEVEDVVPLEVQPVPSSVAVGGGTSVEENTASPSSALHHDGEGST